MRRWYPRAQWLLPLLALALAACDDDSPGAPPTEPPPGPSASEQIARTLPTSLHGTANGMKYWYEQPDGFGPMTGVPYASVACGNCHVPPNAPEGCTGCHKPGETPAAGNADINKCLNCHSRQKSEMAMNLPDVHRAAGMVCWDCHTSKEIHGDGTPDNSFMDKGVMEVTCTKCHTEGGKARAMPRSRPHVIHDDKLACSTCHMATSVTCVNCHFQDEIDGKGKTPIAKVAGWQFLGNYRGQVYPMNFQSVEWKDKTFIAWGPFYGHTITKAGRGCGDCHGTATVKALNASGGTLQIVKWDEATKKIVPIKGVVPIPPNYRSAFLFDFATLNPDRQGWSFLEKGPDQHQMLFGTPLTMGQMMDLATGQ